MIFSCQVSLISVVGLPLILVSEVKECIVLSLICVFIPMYLKTNHYFKNEKRRIFFLDFQGSFYWFGLMISSVGY